MYLSIEPKEEEKKTSRVCVGAKVCNSGTKKSALQGASRETHAPESDAAAAATRTHRERLRRGIFAAVAIAVVFVVALGKADDIDAGLLLLQLVVAALLAARMTTNRDWRALLFARNEKKLVAALFLFEQRRQERKERVG